MLEKPINDDPMDTIDVNDLEGWTRRDSDGMREKNIRQGLDGSPRSGNTNPWVSLGNS